MRQMPSMCIVVTTPQFGTSEEQISLPRGLRVTAKAEHRPSISARPSSCCTFHSMKTRNQPCYSWIPGPMKLKLTQWKARLSGSLHVAELLLQKRAVVEVEEVSPLLFAPQTPHLSTDLPTILTTAVPRLILMVAATTMQMPRLAGAEDHKVARAMRTRHAPPLLAMTIPRVPRR